MPCALGQPDQVGRMIVAQHPGRLARRSPACSASRHSATKSARGLIGHRDAEPRQIPVEQQLDLDQIGVDVVGRQRVHDVRRDRDRVAAAAGCAARPARRPPPCSAPRSAPADRRTPPARRRGPRGCSRPSVKSACVDLRRREAALAQPVRHRDERHDVLGEMRDRAVGLAVAHRRPVRPARRVHQDGALVAELEPLVGARRGVALDAPRARPAP